MSITRRLFLRNTAAVGAVGVSAAPAVAAVAIQNQPEISPDAALFDLIREFDVAVVATNKAWDDLQWLADEWRHIWPLAPEEILRSANAGPNTMGFVYETDILGRPLERETVSLTVRLSKEFRSATRKTCFYLDTATEIRERLEEVRKRMVKGRTAKSFARNQTRRTEYIDRLKRDLVLTEVYEAETARIREAARVDDARQRLNRANFEKTRLENLIYAFPVATFAGLETKARVSLQSKQSHSLRGAPGVIGLATGFAEDIKRISALEQEGRV